MTDTSILIADDHPIFVDGIVSLIGGIDGFSVVSTAVNGKDALDKIPESHPDIVLMDINMPEMDGVEATRVIKDQYPDVKVIMLTMYDEIRLIKDVLEIGARGYILKNIGREDLIKALETVSNGQPYLDPAVQEKMIISLSGNEEDVQDEPNAELVNSITAREMEILQLIAMGMTSGEIAKKLFISKNTVETHRKNLLGKLNVKNTAALLKFAYQNGLV
ncbi:MAG: response regulator transcription factor [Bacteroidetes bacterium]|nr:response regulator transcription factor [Bacteroidota bacterium]